MLQPAAEGATSTDVHHAREFYRYYEPFQTLSSARPAFVNVRDAESMARHRPTSSPNKALTSFCQLTAIRLRAKRSMLFFFDAHHAYVLAEATQSLSLQCDSRHDPGDGLWLGHAVFNKGCTVCEHTVQLPHASTPAERVHLVPDLRADTRFQSCPYVTSAPYARFYAGTPIVTPSGIQIGALCVLDPEPHSGLSANETEFLTDMATTIAEHLGSLRATAEHARSTRMVAGLSAYIQAMSSQSSGGAVPSHNAPLTPQPDSSDSQHIDMAVNNDSTDGPPEEVPEIERQVQSMLRKSSAVELPEAECSRPETSGTQRPFQLAASIVQQALDVDGVLFVDASADSLGGLLDEASMNVEHACYKAPDDQNALCSSVAEAVSECGQISDEEHRNCELLGAASRDEPIFSSQSEHYQISQRFLRHLLTTYPRGHVWNSDEIGTSAVCSRDARTDESLNHEDQSWESRMLRKLFPGVQNLALVPMWDHKRGRWHAGAIMYSYSPIRTFTDEGDLNFMAAFCDTILVELARSSIEATLKAKSAFLSSVTHELRTPLHGILGTVENIWEETNPAVVTKLIMQIDACGRGLLDVIDHILDFSELDHIVSQKNVHPNKAFTSMQSRNCTSDGQQYSAAQVQGIVDLDKITEQAVNTAVLSYQYTNSNGKSNNRDVTVILDIEPTAPDSWTCLLPAVAWKRVCTNLVSNALKYTSHGHVAISLQRQPRRPESRELEALFIVEDTGCGMSPEFLANSLFKDFQRENAFVPGVGLGLSIVGKIIKLMHGSVRVQSVQGKGTTVTVSLPLQYAADLSTCCQIRSDLNGGNRFDAQDVRIGFLGNWSTKAAKPARMLLQGSVQRILKGLNARVCLDQTSVRDCHLHIILEEDIPLVAALGDLAAHSQKPLLVICRSIITARQLESSHEAQKRLLRARVEYMTQPCGPVQVAEAIKSLITHDTAIGVTSTSSTISEKRTTVVLQRPNPARWSSTGTESPVTTTMHKSVVVSETQLTTECVFLDKPNPKIPPNRPFALTASHTNINSYHTSTTLAMSCSTALHTAKVTTTSSHPTDNPLAHLTFLLVDDNNVNLRLLTMNCRRRNFRSLTATDGLEAYETYKRAALTEAQARKNLGNELNSDGNQIPPEQRRPHVILMDINMPIMDGYESTRRIRALEKRMGPDAGKPALIVAVTGLGSTEARQQALASGIDLFMQKPVDFKVLVKLLNDRFERGKDSRA